MALLIDIRLPSWMTEEQVRDLLAPHLPGVPIYCRLEQADPAQVIMIAVNTLYPGVAPVLPNLQVIQKLGAGVEGILAMPERPAHARVTRLAPEASANEIVEYCLAYVLAGRRNLSFHDHEQSARRWTKLGPHLAEETSVGVLGLGHIGGRTARAFADMGYRTLGWSRSPKTIEGVECHAGGEALPGLLAECDYIASILPSTPATTNLLDAAMLAAMKPEAVLINAGRGDVLVDDDLIAALDAGQLGGAVLDVFREEPLPPEHAFWSHPKIRITPHVSGWNLGDAILDAAENYRRLVAHEPLLHEVNLGAGY